MTRTDDERGPTRPAPRPLEPPPSTGESRGDALRRLVAIVDRLRDPESGCPWDLEQTVETLAPSAIEEAFELVEAVERRASGEAEDEEEVVEEAGDLLMLIVLVARIAEQGGRFDLARVAGAVGDKLVRRHPHVFGNADVTSAPHAIANWERIKQAERDQKQREAQVADTPPSVLDDISASLPALLRAHKLQKRAASVGFDWHSLEPVLDTLASEIEELREAVRLQQPEAVADELGDLFFSCVNLARHLRLDAEQVLRQANRKFEQRFRLVEQLATEQGLAMEASSEEQLDRLWQEAKRRLHRT